MWAVKYLFVESSQDGHDDKKVIGYCYVICSQMTKSEYSRCI